MALSQPLKVLRGDVLPALAVDLEGAHKTNSFGKPKQIAGSR